MAETPETRFSDYAAVPRTSSPSPSVSPTPALFACPPLERSVSTTSTTSSFSRTSSGSHSSDTIAARRRGYARPQGTSFADSARNRESVMSLGSITHLQHYFARTGLLDGKNGRMATGKPKKVARPSDAALSDLESSGFYLSSPTALELDTGYSSLRASPEVILPGGRRVSTGSMTEPSPADDQFTDGLDDELEPGMLPPTVSTYKDRSKPLPPPPSPDELRAELRKALVEARKVLQGAVPEPEERGDFDVPQETHGRVAAQGPSERAEAASDSLGPDSSEASFESQGWYELQGLNVLDTMTLASRAAKMYYTAHEQPARLASIRSERKLRQDLLAVLDVLKRMAVRNFAGGMRLTERTVLVSWIDGVEALLAQEEQIEAIEVQERESRGWMQGDWTGREREREWLFLRSFDTHAEEVLPRWTSPADALGGLPTDFLQALRTGLCLVRAHNEMVRKSRRPFGQITAFHTDTLKPYRCADNLRYWIKAAELRWDIVLHVDVLGVVYGRSDEVWRQFDVEILRWCTKVREEIAAEWTEKASRLRRRQSGDGTEDSFLG